MSESEGGRPSSYRATFAVQAYKLCLLGAKDKDLADFFEVSETTINNWKDAHPKFLASLKRGKDTADAQVANSLFRKALGYKHKAVKIFCTKEGDIVEAPFIQHYAPDTTACIFWLKNRNQGNWREKREDDTIPNAQAIALAIREALRGIDEAA